MMARMPSVRVLPDPLVNRIAAGEVVERPASVVKELVENSLDAAAERIELELELGGRRLIRVIDDGDGMDGDDALLCLERHATSKITSAEDLERIATMGFRGEALPSIAAVSRLTLTTCADPEAGGVRVVIEGGRVLGVEGAARARGTTVEVRDLFFNTPARRKFLHAPETELRHAQEIVWGAALSRPDVGFVLRHGGRTLLEAPPAVDAAARLADLWRRRSGPVNRFEAMSPGIRVTGLVGLGSGSGRPALTFLVNGRPVRDRLLVGAVLRVLREAGGGFGGSRIVVAVDVPPDAVDVNVHPTKAEVRFVRGGGVFQTVERAVRNGIAAAQGKVPIRRFDPVAGPQAGGARVAETSPESYGGQTGTSSSAHGSLFEHPVYSTTDPTTTENAPPAAVSPRSGARAGSPDTPFGRLIGQYRRSFLLLEDDWGLLIVDQHVAHERVLYDRIRRRLAGENAPSQGLIEPLLIEVEESGVAALPRVQAPLAKVGIEAEAFGGDTVRLTALPPEIESDAACDLLLELLDSATRLDGVPERVAEIVEEELAASLSCRAAIKINHDLAWQEQRALLDDLAASDNPYRCPHGRPIVLRLSQEEMERRLGRR